jgi:hypothetical protein
MSEKMNVLFGSLFILCLVVTVSSSFNGKSSGELEGRLSIDKIVTENRPKVVRFSPHYTKEGASVTKEPRGMEYYIVRTGYEQFDNYCDLTLNSKLPLNSPD